jgi:hypothetical protein
MRLFYSRGSNSQLVGYAYAGYLSDLHKGRSQTRYLFTCENTAISLKSVKQTLVVTSSNHLEIIATHEASQECIWLRSLIQHIRENVVCLQSKIARQYYMKIMLLVSHRSEEDILKVTEPNTFHQSSFIHMSSRRVVKLMSSIYDQVTICHIHLPKHYQLQHSRSC